MQPAEEPQPVPDLMAALEASVKAARQDKDSGGRAPAGSSDEDAGNGSKTGEEAQAHSGAKANGAAARRRAPARRRRRSRSRRRGYREAGLAVRLRSRSR